MRKVLFTLFIMFFGGLAFAQSADFVTKIINSDKVTYGQISYLAGVHQGLIDSDFTGDDSVVSHDSWEIANNNGLIPEGVLDTDFVTAENLAYIYAKIWNLGSASLFCKLTKGSPRYSFKLMKSDGVIPDRIDPTAAVNGREALNILTACMITYGYEDECMDMDLE